MHSRWASCAGNRVSSAIAAGILFLAFAALSTGAAFAIPAFARKYGLRCSSCHEAWPKLNNFGQVFKDNGYQLGNDRDAPIYQQPAYWPVSMRITPHWHRESTSLVAVDQAASGVQSVSTHGFDLSGLDLLSAGTLGKNISFLLVPSADNTGAFHFESAWARFDNLLKSPWLNVKMGKFELDNVISEKRILTLSQNGGLYQIYHFLPVGDANPNGFGLGDNQLGLELMGHSRNSYTRYSAAVLSSNDGNVGLPTSRGYDTFFTVSQAFEAGGLGLQRVGAFSYNGRLPTYSLTTTTTGPDGTPISTAIPGTGIGNKPFYRVGAYGLFYVKKLDFMTMFTHAGESAYLATNTPKFQALPPGSSDPVWNGGMIETHYTWNPQFILLNRYELIRMSTQVSNTSPSNLGDLDSLTFGYRWYPIMSSRAGFAIHNEYSIVRNRRTFPTGQDVKNSSVFLGFDFIF